MRNASAINSAGSMPIDIENTLFASIILVFAQMVIYKLFLMDVKLFFPIGNEYYWVGVAMLHSYHYIEDINFGGVVFYFACVCVICCG